MYHAIQIKDGLHELSIPTLQEVSLLRNNCDMPTQISLPEEVRGALIELNHLFVGTNDKKNQQAAEASPLNTSSAKQLFKNIQKLYADVPLSSDVERYGVECLSVVIKHLQNVARQLAENGYPDSYVNFARNGFSDFLHGHPFCTYVVYAGRSCGTDVVVGGGEEAGISPVTSRYPLLTFRYASSRPEILERLIRTSDVNQGLFLPKYSAHRANRPDSTALQSAELAIVLFALERSPSGKMIW